MQRFGSDRGKSGHGRCPLKMTFMTHLRHTATRSFDDVVGAQQAALPAPTIVFSVLSEIGKGACLAGGEQSCCRVRQRHRCAQAQLCTGRQDRDGQSRIRVGWRLRVGLRDAA